MAEVHVYRFEFTQNSYGVWVTGDVVDVYIDTDLAVSTPVSGYSGWLTGIVVYKNSVLVTSGDFIDFLHVAINRFNPIVCISNSLLEFSLLSVHPYAMYYPQASHYSCITNPPTCNLFVIGVPSVVSATSTTATDGSITVAASSSNAIQYKLGSDFVYGDGSAQTTGVFTGLGDGDYRIYIRDEANCLAAILVTVPISNEYGPVYRLEYDDINNWQTKIEVTKRNYSGAVTEVCGAGQPFTLSLRGEGSIDKFESILAIEANLNLTSETDLQFLELYTNDPNLYRVDYYKDTGSGYALKWTGKILPQQYSEEYKAPPYYVSVVATDALPELKDFYLVQDDGQPFFGEISLIKLVAYCLGVLKIDLPIRVACNLYATTMDQTAADDPFDQAYVDFERFYLAEKQPTLDFVLRSILEPFGARITQWDGRWNIVRVEEMRASYDYRNFDSSGDYVSNGTYNPVKDIDFPTGTGDVLLANADHNLEIRPGYGNIRVNYQLGLKPNILDNGDFRLKSFYDSILNQYFFSINRDGWTIVNAGYAISEAFENVDDNNVALIIKGNSAMVSNTAGGNAYLQSDTYTVKMGTNNQMKISLTVKVPKAVATFGTMVFQANVPYIKVRMRVKYGLLYLQADGSWTSTANILTFFLQEYDKYQTFEIIANQPGSGTPLTGMALDVRVYHAYPYHVDYQSLTALRALVTYSGGAEVIPTGYKTQLRDSFTGPAQYVYYYELEENTSAASGYDVVRPNDYHATNNPRQWILKLRHFITGIGSSNTYDMNVDKVVIQYLTNRKECIDTVVRIATGESGNKETFQKDLYFGSYSNLVVSEPRFGLTFIDLAAGYKPGLALETQNILASDLIYTGYLRDSTGSGYEFWARDGVSEEDKLHGIWLKMYALQYKQSWRLLRGSFYTLGYFGMLDVLRNVNDDNRIYLPIGLTFDDKQCIYSGELLELVTVDDDSDGSGVSPFSSAFSIGFGQAGFN